MPANWDFFQRLNGGRIEWPTGPISGLDTNDVPLWVNAWVVQGEGEGADVVLHGPSQSTSHSPSWAGWGAAPFDRWTADVAEWADGKFKAGEFALGISILAVRDGSGAPKFDWWFQPIFLQ